MRHAQLMIVVNFGAGLTEENEKFAEFMGKVWSMDRAGAGWSGGDDLSRQWRHDVVEVCPLRHLLLWDFPGCGVLFG